MASKTTKPTTNTNSTARKEAARKSGKCQKCGAKTKGRSVTVNYETGKITKSPLGKAKDGYAYYCDDCADKKVKRYQWRIKRREEAGTTGPKAKAKTTKAKGKAKAKATTAKPKAKKATTKAAAKPKAKATAKPGTAKAKAAAKRKATTKAKPEAAKPASTEASDEPF